MSILNPTGKFLILAGIIIIIAGIIIGTGLKVPFIGRLPGDIYIKKENFTFYFPLATCVVASIIITLIVRFIRK